MKKRHLISAVAMILALMLLGLSGSALAEKRTVGLLSYLNMTEEEDESIGLSVRAPMRKLLSIHGVLSDPGSRQPGNDPFFRQYDSLNAMLMGLESKEINAVIVPYSTGRYLCSVNDGLQMETEYHPENATKATDWALSRLSDGYSFMMKEENTALRNDFDAQISAMKEDGTLQKLIDEHITKVSEGGEPVAIAFEKFEGDPIRIAVTGSLPPMDYVAADGTFAGFNTAVLAEIGKRLQKNIELVQVDSVGRALALSEGTVDVVFWTRGTSESVAEQDATLKDKEDALAARAARMQEILADEEEDLRNELTNFNQDNIIKNKARDIPAGTIITQPYFTDFPVCVGLK